MDFNYPCWEAVKMDRENCLSTVSMSKSYSLEFVYIYSQIQNTEKSLPKGYRSYQETLGRNCRPYTTPDRREKYVAGYPYLFVLLI